MLPLTVDAIIERARGRFWAFNEVQMPAGAIVQYLDERQRVVLLAIIDEAEPLIGETREIETSGTATLVAVDSTGAPYFATTRENSFALRFQNGVPYIDVNEVFVVDPFGQFGDVPGLPLPDDHLRLTCVTAILDDTREMPVTILEQQTGSAGGGSTGLRAFVSANRLVPIRQSNQDWWSHVESVRVSLVLCPELTALTDTITLPKPCVDALTAAVAEFLATACRECGENDKRRFERQYKDSFALMKSTADEILSQVTTNQVVHRR